MTKTEIYVGLNDQDTKTQKFETAKYTNILKHVCVQYRVPFSVHVIEGGYVHDDGEYTEENTLVLTLIGTDKTVVDAIAEDLCVFFRQESVLITSGEIETYSIRGRL